MSTDPLIHFCSRTVVLVISSKHLPSRSVTTAITAFCSIPRNYIAFISFLDGWLLEHSHHLIRCGQNAIGRPSKLRCNPLRPNHRHCVRFQPWSRDGETQCDRDLIRTRKTMFLRLFGADDSLARRLHVAETPWVSCFSSCLSCRATINTRYRDTVEYFTEHIDTTRSKKKGRWPHGLGGTQPHMTLLQFSPLL